jgi:nucleoid DNA-binding protein
MAQAKQTARKSSGKMTKAALIDAIVELSPEGTTRAQVKGLLATLTAVAYKELRKNGMFVLPGFAKLVVVKKPARPARKGINPFTKEPTTFAAKPASKVVRARPVKALKDAVA